MKIIFLDVDGVLNFAMTEARAPSGCLGIASQPLKNLRNIVKATGAYIVLTSTWKQDWDFNEENCPPDGQYLVRRLKREGLHILDKTDDKILDRGQGIVDWLTRHKGVESWVAIDDEVFPDYEACGIMPHLIQTSFGGDGLNELLAAQAINELNKGDNHA